MSQAVRFILTLLAMTAFAANSLLCRFALLRTGIDPASFTSIRIASGALVLWLIMRLRPGQLSLAGDWPSALALFAYAIGFSYAYIGLPAATGALVLFGAVQTTMIGYGVWSGERPGLRQGAGIAAAIAGLAGLLYPGLSAPPLAPSALMLGAGVAWGIYSLRGRGAGDPVCVTAGNFMRALPFAAIVSVATTRWTAVDVTGCCYALLSGGLASGAGYAVWYTALRGMKATTAATVQLSVPVIAAAGGVFFLGEAVTLRLLLASAAILGGIALVVVDRRPRPVTKSYTKES
jgi:drug/metabolite transporter (DMT)-like permease